ncbi:hypothetical protein T439DRAFT_321906 [Meredithblackwellia eburnea MCA 4105]
MAQVTPQESQRIIAHMNKEHAESLEHYIEFYGKKNAAQNPLITTFTTEKMEIEYGRPGARKTFTHKFDPPMMAGQARVRLEQMHQEARKGLGISNVIINEFSLSYLAWFFFLVATSVEMFGVFCPTEQLASLVPRLSTPTAALLRYLNIAPTRFHVGLALKLFFLLGWAPAHLLEMSFTLVPLLKKYNCSNPDARYKYKLFTFLGGFTVWTDLQRRGQALEEEATKKDKSH